MLLKTDYDARELPPLKQYNIDWSDVELAPSIIMSL